MQKVAITGLLFLVSVSTLFRGLYYRYDTYAFLAGIALLAALYFLAKMNGKEKLRTNKIILIFGVLLVCSVLLSFIRSVNPKANLDMLSLNAISFMAFIILFDFFYDKKQLLPQSLMTCALSAGVISSIVGLLAVTGVFQVWEVTVNHGRIGSTFQYANTAAIYFVICSIFAITLANNSDSILLKALFTGMGNLTVFAFFMTGSRGGYIIGTAIILFLLMIQPSGAKLKSIKAFICMLLPVFLIIKGFNTSTAAGDVFGTVMWLAVSFLIAAVGELIISYLCKLILKKKQIASSRGSGFIFAASIIVALIIVVLFRNDIIRLLPPIMASRLTRLVNYGFNDVAFLYRMDYARDDLKLITGNWLLGLGGGGWNALYTSVQEYNYTAAFVHNQYLQVFVEHGILGFLSFTALTLISLYYAIYSCIRARGAVVRTYCAGLLCTLLALLAHSSLDFDLSYASLILLLWAMFAASSVGITTVKGREATANKAGMSENTGNEANSAGLTGATHTRYSKLTALVLVIVSSVLFAMNALYFTAAHSAQNGFDASHRKDYVLAAAYYEDAKRLDPSNSEYNFELAKLYLYFADKSSDKNSKYIWLEKARSSGESSVAGNRHYPPYMNTLVRIYLDSDMPVKALEYSEKLVADQKYYAENYELLAASYLAAAEYYEKSGGREKSAEMLRKCIEIDKNPNLHRSGIEMPYDVGSEEIISKYRHTEKLAGYLKEAGERLENLQ